MTNQNSKFINLKYIAKRYLNFDFCILRLDFKQGFTLLETLVALAVLLAATVGPVALITKGIFSVSFAKNKTIANGLAQEGIELVRAVRENNILCDKLNGAPVWGWNRDPDGGNLTNTTREADVLNTATITCGAYSISTPRLSVYAEQKLRLDPSTGIYSYGGSQETIFVRRIDIRVPPDDPDSGIPASEQMDVISTVAWTEKGMARNLVLKERLYNWR